MGQNDSGIQVIDQWKKRDTGKDVRQVAHERTINWMGGHGSAVDDGDQYYVVN
jgi:hypothetical protein